MKIKDTFRRDIARSINGVIKASQVDKSSVWQELDEFVVTNELKKHMDALIEVMASTLDDNTQAANSNGIWVSGFFGSGKSHFIKVLSYLLRNEEHEFDGQRRRAVDFFEEKLKDPLSFSELKRVVDAGIAPILFNIDDKASHREGRDAILQVFLKVLNEHQGYCGEYPHIAHMERYLGSKGLLLTFQQTFERESGQNWVGERDAWEFLRDEVTAALAETLGQSTESAEKWVDGAEDNFSLTAENFAGWVKAWLDTQPKGQRLMFLVDELGQFIGGDTHLMLNLQTIAEQLGTVCEGRAWITVTSQEDLDSVLGGDRTTGKQNDFSKIQGRFKTRLSLSSANVDEVIKTRLLEKREEARGALEGAYLGREDILKNQLAFTDTGATFKNYTGVEDFCESYPFAAYQFFLVQKVFESIRKAGATGLHLSQGERSTLDAFQGAAKALADREIGSLVSFDAFYPSVEGFLDTSVKRTIDQSDTNASLKPFDITLLKVLFLIRYIDELPGKIDNLLVLLTAEIDSDRVALRAAVEESLKRLENETLIARNDDRYSFLTNEEQDIGREIKNQSIPAGEEIRELGKMLFTEAMADQSKHTYGKTGRNFPYSRLCDEVVHGGSGGDGLELSLVTPLSEHYAEYCEDARCILHTAEHNFRLLVRLPDDKDIDAELRTWLRTESYIKSKSASRLEHSTKSIIEDRARENRTRRQRLVSTLRDALDQSDYFACGQTIEMKARDAKGALAEALNYLIANAYTKMTLITHLTPEPQREVQTILRANDVQALDLDGEIANPGALDEIRDYLRLAEQGARKVVLSDMIDERFGRAPYGWPEWETILLVARLAVMRELDLIVNAAPLPFDKAYESFASVRARKQVMIKLRQSADAGLIKKAQQLGRGLFGGAAVGDEAALFTELKTKLNNWHTQVSEYHTRASAGDFPGENDLDAGLATLKPLIGEADSLKFLKRFVDAGADLQDFYEDYQDINTFYKNQIPLWQNLREALQHTLPNERQLAQVPEADKALRRLNEIREMRVPYTALHEIQPLIESAESANAQLLSQARKAAMDDIARLQQQLQQELDRVAADDALKLRAGAGLQTLSRDLERQNSVAHIEQLGRDAERALEAAMQLIDQHLARQSQAQAEPVVDEKSGEPQQPPAPPVAAPKPRVVVRAVDAWSGGFIESADDINAYLDALRQQLQAAIDAGERVQLK